MRAQNREGREVATDGKSKRINFDDERREGNNQTSMKCSHDVNRAEDVNRTRLDIFP